MKFFRGKGKTLSEGSPMFTMGFYLSTAFPQIIPFGNGTLWLDQVVSLANSCTWGVVVVGNIIFSPSCSTPGLPQGAPPHKIPPGRMPICGNPSFPPNHAASLASQAPLPINYVQEDAHPWEMLPSATSPSGYLSQLPCNPFLMCVDHVTQDLPVGTDG